MKTNKLQTIDQFCNVPKGSFKKFANQLDKATIHRNKKVRNIITGKNDRTMSQLKRQAKESAVRIINAFKVSDGI